MNSPEDQPTPQLQIEGINGVLQKETPTSILKKSSSYHEDLSLSKNSPTSTITKTSLTNASDDQPSKSILIEGINGMRPLMLRTESSKSILKKSPSYHDDPTFSSSTTSLRKNVSFNKIEINQFPMVLGDNPSAVNGIPIQIGWQAHRRDVFELDHYENLSVRGQPRDRRSMIIPPERRLGLVQLQGATMRDIADVTHTKKQIQKSRYESINNMQWDRYHEQVEKVQRKFGKLKRAATWTSNSLSSRKSNSNNNLPLHGTANATINNKNHICNYNNTRNPSSTANATFDNMHAQQQKGRQNISRLKKISGIRTSKPVSSSTKLTRMKQIPKIPSRHGTIRKSASTCTDLSSPRTGGGGHHRNGRMNAAIANSNSNGKMKLKKTSTSPSFMPISKGVPGRHGNMSTMSNNHIITNGNQNALFEYYTNKSLQLSTPSSVDGVLKSHVIDDERKKQLMNSLASSPLNPDLTKLIKHDRKTNTLRKPLLAKRSIST